MGSGSHRVWRAVSPRLVLLLALPLLAGLPGPTRGDAIIVTRAATATTITEIFIEKDSIRVDLEIGLPDLSAFRNLLPDELYERLGNDPEPLAARLPRFFREDLVLRPDAGAPLMGRIEEMLARPRIVRDQVTGDPLPVAEDEGELVVFARLDYSLKKRPEALTVSPPRSEAGHPVANIGFMVYHRGLPVIDFRYLGVEETLNLDWEDPWYSRFENRNLRRQYDAPLSAFIYVEPYEVRKEIVVRPLDLQHWIDLGLEGKEIIPAGEQAELKAKVAEFLAGNSPLTIDGVPAEGTLDRIHFVRRSLRRTGVIDPPEDLETISATLGVIYVYPRNGLPQEVALEWELFNPRIQKVPGVATDEAGGLPSFLVPDDPVLRWQNFLTNPTVPGLVEVQTPPQPRSLWLTLAALLCGAGIIALAVRHVPRAVRGQAPPRWAMAAGAGLVLVLVLAVPRVLRPSGVSHEEAGTIVADLLRNIYQSFDYRDESVIYDRLEQSAAGDLLTEVYLETRRSLELENQGGARVKVKDVEMLDATTESLPGEQGFVAHCTWNVSGSVGHWGHIHQRTNQYEARFTVKVLEGAWKVTGLELLQEERL
jgi:hypothetical protein